MHRENGIGFLARRPQRIPVARVKGGKADLVRRSGKVSAWKPRAALARTSPAAMSRPAGRGIWHGMIRSGRYPAHSSSCQSLQARDRASTNSGSGEHDEADPSEAEQPTENSTMRTRRRGPYPGTCADVPVPGGLRRNASVRRTLSSTSWPTTAFTAIWSTKTNVEEPRLGPPPVR